MYNHQKSKITMLFSCLAISMLALSTGCRSGSFTKPDLGKLAFWKSDNFKIASKDTVAPPPPARHFDPAPITEDPSATDRDSEIVNLDNSKLQRRFKNDIEEMQAEIEAANKALGTPIRKPYSTGVADSANELASKAKSSFESATETVQSQLDEFGGQMKSGLSAAQNDFQAAMNNTTKSISNDFAATKESAKNVAQDWQNNIDNSFAAVNKAMDGAKNNLTGKLDSQSDNSFKSGIGEFGGSLAPLKSDAVPTKPKQELVQNQIAEAKRQIDELKQQVASSQPSTPHAFPAQGFSGDHSFDSPIDNSFAGASSSSESSQAPTQGERVAKLQSPGTGYPLASSSTNDQTPSNRLRADQPDESKLSSTFSPQDYPSTSHGGFAPRSNDFSGNFSPLQKSSPQKSATVPAVPVDFENTTDGSMVVTANNAFSSAGTGSAEKIQNHVSEIDIPESVLKGSGSYAPGSIQPLRGNQ